MLKTSRRASAFLALVCSFLVAAAAYYEPSLILVAPAVQLGLIGYCVTIVGRANKEEGDEWVQSHPYCGMPVILFWSVLPLILTNAVTLDRLMEGSRGVDGLQYFYVLGFCLLLPCQAIFETEAPISVG